MDYFGARYYSSAQARFTSPDEFTGGPEELFEFADLATDNPTFYANLFQPQSLNKYQYCLNNPFAYIDPDGHQVEALLLEGAKTSVRTGNVGAAAGFAVGAAYFYIMKKWGDPKVIGDGSCPSCDRSVENYIHKKEAEMEAKRQPKKRLSRRPRQQRRRIKSLMAHLVLQSKR